MNDRKITIKKFYILLVVFFILLSGSIFLVMRLADNEEVKVQEMLMAACLKSSELLEKQDGYSYIWNRAFYADGECVTDESGSVSFLTTEDGCVMENQYYPGESRSVYFHDKAYSYDADEKKTGILCLTQEECQEAIESWSAAFAFEYDADEEQITDWNQTSQEQVIITNVNYEGGSTRWSYTIEPKEGRVLEVKGEDFDEAGTFYGSMTVSFNYERPDIDMDFITQIEQGDWSEPRICTLITDPNTEKEQVEQYRIPQGFSFFLIEDEGYQLYEDAEGEEPARWGYPEYGNLVLYQIAIEKQEE